MTSRLNPYINFPGTARQAMEFYQNVLGGELNISTFGEYGAAEGEAANRVMHANLETPLGFALMASDFPSEMEHQPGNNMSVSISGDDAEELRGYWEKLSDGGEITMPLEKQAWGDEFGSVIDKFGTAWLVNISQPTAG